MIVVYIPLPNSALEYTLRCFNNHLIQKNFQLLNAKINKIVHYSRELQGLQYFQNERNANITTFCFLVNLCVS